LPEDFQFFGLWLLLCFYLNAFYTIKIFNLYKTNVVITIAAALIITANPVLIFRGMHPSLCAHWLLLASLYNYLVNSTKDNVEKLNKNQFIIFLLSATINPYLALMVGGFNIILPLKHYLFEKTLKIKRAIIFAVVSFASAIIFWLIFGLIVFSNNTNLDVGNIYGMYAFNLNSFVNSYGFYSHFLPNLGMVTDFQHEGFAYLGMGMICIVLIAIVFLFYKLIVNKLFYTKFKKFLPLLVLCFMLFVFAVSNKVSLGTKELFTYPTFGIVEKVGNIFRATGRFIWIVYYVIIIFSLLIFSKIKISNYIKLPILLLLLGLQFYDTENLLTIRNLHDGKFHTKVNDEKWIPIFKEFGEIITYPPFTNNIVYSNDYQDLSFLALKAHKPITNGYVARENLTLSQAYKDTLRNKLNKGEIAKNQLFITSTKKLEDFNSLFYYDKVFIKKLDNFILIYSKENKISKLFDKASDDKRFLDSIKESNSKKGNLKIFKNKISEGNFEKNIEYYNYSNNAVNISGWIIDKSTRNNKGDSIYVSLKNDKSNYFVPTNFVDRADITAVYKKPYLNDAGFNATFFTNKIPKSDYNLSLVVKNKNGEYKQLKTDIIVPVGKNIFKTAKVVKTIPKTSLNIISNLEKVEDKKDHFIFSGWAAIEKIDSRKTIIEFVLIKENKNYVYETDVINRKDVTVANLNKFNYDNSGFYLKIKKNTLSKGNYKLGILITDLQTKSIYFKLQDKIISL
jgi:hypothetical protein